MTEGHTPTARHPYLGALVAGAVLVFALVEGDQHHRSVPLYIAAIATFIAFAGLFTNYFFPAIRQRLVWAAAVLLVAWTGVFCRAEGDPCTRRLHGRITLVEGTRIGNPDAVVCFDDARIELVGSIDFRVLARQVLVLRASEIRGVGTPGQNGQPGKKAAGGRAGACRDISVAFDYDDVPSWCTENHDDWVDANVDCDDPARPTCDRGGDAENAGDGSPGPSVAFLVARAPDLSRLSIVLQGGPPGLPGEGGAGMRHYWTAPDPGCPVDYGLLHPENSDRQRVHQCPAGRRGAVAKPGAQGTCSVQILDQAPQPCH